MLEWKSFLLLFKSYAENCELCSNFMCIPIASEWSLSEEISLIMLKGFWALSLSAILHLRDSQVSRKDLCCKSLTIGEWIALELLFLLLSLLIISSLGIEINNGEHFFFFLQFKVRFSFFKFSFYFVFQNI